jgi:hypothetical protein
MRILGLYANASALRGASSVSSPRSDRRLADLARCDLRSLRSLSQSYRDYQIVNCANDNDLANTTCQIVIIVSLDNQLP